MKTIEEIQIELNNLRKALQRHVELLNNSKEYKQDEVWIEQINHNIKYYHDRIMMLNWVLGISNHY